jgi:hypothetical protein
MSKKDATIGQSKMVLKLALELLRQRMPQAMPPDLGRYPSAIRDARAALTLLRKPMPVMLNAAELFEDEKPMSDWGKMTPATPLEIWRAMIDEALRTS